MDALEYVPPLNIEQLAIAEISQESIINDTERITLKGKFTKIMNRIVHFTSTLMNHWISTIQLPLSLYSNIIYES